MKKAYMFRIYPNKNQDVILNRTLSTCRHLYNNSLAERKKQAELNRLKKSFDVFPWGYPERVNKYGQMRYLTATKTEYQKEVYGQVLQFSIKDGKLHLSKIGNIKIILHQEIEEPTPVKINTKTGIDVGLIDLVTLSNVQQVKPPKFLRESEDKLTQEQKRLSRKKKGSGKRNRQKIIVAKVHRKIRNQRKDFVHKLSRNLVDTYDSIKFEDLQIKNMVQNHRLAKSINDAGWYQLMQFTKYKAEYAGKLVEFVNPAGTSQTCICGFHVPKSLSLRISGMKKLNIFKR